MIVKSGGLTILSATTLKYLLAGSSARHSSITSGRRGCLPSRFKRRHRTRLAYRAIHWIIKLRSKRPELSHDFVSREPLFNSFSLRWISWGLSTTSIILSRAPGRDHLLPRGYGRYLILLSGRLLERGAAFKRHSQAGQPNQSKEKTTRLR